MHGPRHTGRERLRAEGVDAKPVSHLRRLQRWCRRRLGTWGVSTSHLTLEGSDFASLNALYRDYPQGAALSGFFLGGRVGSYHVSDEGESGEALGLGFEDAAQRQLLCRAPGTSGFRTRPAIVHNAR